MGSVFSTLIHCIAYIILSTWLEFLKGITSNNQNFICRWNNWYHLLYASRVNHENFKWLSYILQCSGEDTALTRKAPAYNFWPKYKHECHYPFVFSTQTLQCENYTDVDCGSRFLPIWACKYSHKHCVVMSIKMPSANLIKFSVYLSRSLQSRWSRTLCNIFKEIWLQSLYFKKFKIFSISHKKDLHKRSMVKLT